MGRKLVRVESDSDKEDGGAKINTSTGDAMEIDSTPAPAVDKKKAAADARAERAARRKQRREQLADGESPSTSLASTPNPDTESTTPAKVEKKTKRKKTEKKSSPKKAQAETDTTTETASVPESAAVVDPAPVPVSESSNPPANDAEPLPFVIDVKPTKAAVVHDDDHSASASDKGTSVAPSSVNGDGLNRAARRRLMQIERQRSVIKKQLGIPDDSDERQTEVDERLAAWTTQFDDKAHARAAKKMAKKEAGRGKRQGKLLTGRNNNYEKQKQIKKQKQKQALRLRQEAGSGTS
ncbi:hypothetical protein CMUS01_00142 [Colletotrichum musicola]|uniref:Uncharacterized protein n=1 Tax=Colletotrichum musicola TaxID=2175873 RepID=A0A8H6NZB0_9PEZI|nr:hypothetical protein CMUS01_00142 [Colletotrichum musicola]